MTTPSRSSIVALVPTLALALTLAVAGVPVFADPPTFIDDIYSFNPQLGFVNGSFADCFDPHTTGTRDNNVVFDGLSELLDLYTNGTQPFVFEFETSGTGGEDTTAIEINVLTSPGDDLFPEGFEDPESGTPLDAACVEIGIDDTLDGDTNDPKSAPTVIDSTIAFYNDGNPIFSQPIDITSAFSVPWRGRLSIVFPGLTGLNINEIRLNIEAVEDSNNIFSDGFETGNTASWTQTVSN